MEYGPDVHQRFYRTLEIQDGSFISSLTARNLMNKPCESCGRKDIWKSRKTFCPEKYHFVLVNYAKDDVDQILDLTFNSEVEMYGAKWKIISATEKIASETMLTGTEFESMETEVASNRMDTSAIVLDDTITSAGRLLPTPIEKSSVNILCHGCELETNGHAFTMRSFFRTSTSRFWFLRRSNRIKTKFQTPSTPRLNFSYAMCLHQSSILPF